MIGTGLAEREQEVGDLDEAHAMAGATGAVARASANQLLPTPTGPQRITFSWAASQSRLESSRTQRAVVMHGRVPDELVGGDDLVEAGRLDPQAQPGGVSGAASPGRDRSAGQPGLTLA